VRNPNDRLCLARAILLGLKHHRHGRQACRAYHRQQQRHGPEARNLFRRAGISRREHMYTLEHVERMQQWLDQHYGDGEVRLVVFEKENFYRIIYKGATPQARAARFNLCLYYEHHHYHYLITPEQLFRVNRYCIDCERGASRYIHWNGCTVVCRLCMRFGHDFPCRVEWAANGRSSQRHCPDCGFIFANNDCFQFHKNNSPNANVAGPQAPTIRSICEARRLCTHCGAIIYAWSGMGRPHVCTRNPHQHQMQQQNPNALCDKCKGPHAREQPCFIQPLEGHNGQHGEEEEDGDDQEEEDVAQGRQQQTQRAPRRGRPSPATSAPLFHGCGDQPGRGLSHSQSNCT